MKSNVGSVGVDGADKSRFGQASQFDNFAIGLVLVEDKVDGKIFSLLVDRGSTFAKSVFGARNLLTGLGVFDNHVAFVLGKGKQNVGDEFAGGSVVNKPHVEDMNSDAAQ